MGTKKLIFIILAMALSFAVCLEVQAEDSIHFATTKVQALETETPVILKEKFTGKILLLDFWASWCSPCKEALPYYETLQKRFAKVGLQVIAVSVDDDKKSALEFLKDHNYQLSFFWDKDKNVAKSLGVKVLPTTLLIDSEGKILHRERGFFDSSKEVFQKKIVESFKAKRET